MTPGGWGADRPEMAEPVTAILVAAEPAAAAEPVVDVTTRPTGFLNA